MSFMRSIPGTGLEVSALGLGTVKFGRNQGVKYPRGFELPGDREIIRLLDQCRELGINFLDTAPAYGNSEERIGQLLKQRQDWVLCTKVGEEFIAGRSHFDFSAEHTRQSVERSLQRLRTDYLDIVLIHSDGNDEAILQQSGCLECLRRCQEEGLIRAIGMSSKTIAGGLLAARLTDMVMLTYNLQQQDQAVVDYAAEHHKGVLVKKGLMSGHIASGADGVKQSLSFIFKEPAVNSVIVGTINPEHLKENVRLCREILDSSLN